MVVYSFSLAVILLSYVTTVCAFTLSPLQYGRTTSNTEIQMATWSDTKAVLDYQNFLNSGKQEIELERDIPSVVLMPSMGGSTELAEALMEMGLPGDVILTPDHDLPETVGDSSEYPIYVTLPPWQIQDFLTNLPESYKPHMEDFVFFSGGLNYGNIEDVLKDRGYCRDSMTQVLISGMRIPPNRRVQDLHISLGADANGEDKLAGECAACGKWAGAIAERMERNEVFCRTDFYREWRRRMWERNVYDACFHVVGAVREDPTTVGDVAKYYGDEMSDLLWEMSQLLRGWKALTLTYGFEERLFGVAESAGAEQQCTLIEEMYPYIWGNTVYLESMGFVEYLKYAQEMGWMQGVALPERSEDEYTSKMRQGNLRADGVV